MPEDPHRIHRTALILDAHADTPQRFADEPWDFTAPLGQGHLNLETARAGNLAGEIFAIWVEPTQWRDRFAHRALTLLDAVHEQLSLHPAEMQLCLTAEDILAAHAAGRFATLLSIEGGHAIENSLPLLRTFHRLGVRAMTLTWSNSTDWAASSGDTDPASDPGLSSFGHQVVHEMNCLGMIVDISHASDQTFSDVLATSKAPILASHSSARALTHSPRNLTDNQLRALAASGGLACTNFYPAFIDEPWRQAWNAQRPERLAAHESLALAYPNQPIPFHISNRLDHDFSARLGRAPFSSLIDHILHMLHIVGPNHVGIGSDFDGIPHPPAGIDSAADLPRITSALIERGVSPETIHKLLGGNLLRFLRDVEAAANRLRPSAEPEPPPAKITSTE